MKNIEWIPLDEKSDGKSLMHEDVDYGAIIGRFKVEENMLSEGKVGTIEFPHYYTVCVMDREGMIPHFHIYDKEGRKKKKQKEPGIHSCVEILRNKYFIHGKHQDKLDKKIQEALDAFMRTTRTEEKYEIAVGKTNYQYTIAQWNEENETRGKPNWINSSTTPQPDYTSIT